MSGEAAGTPTQIASEVAASLAAEERHYDHSFEPLLTSLLRRHPDLAT